MKKNLDSKMIANKKKAKNTLKLLKKVWLKRKIMMDVPSTQHNGKHFQF